MLRYLYCLLFLCLLSTCRQAEEKTGPPNVLFILTDDQGYGDLSMMGNDSLDTPNLDALLRSSAFFNRFYVSPVCAPTRASFLSGKYAPRTGAVFVTRRRETMDDEVVTLPELLGERGYRTGLFGKWHNGATFPYHPGGQGFDEFLGFTLGHFNDYFNGELQNERDEIVPFSGDLTRILTDTALHFMTQPTEDPFFCMLAYQAPHTPVQVADTFWNKYVDRVEDPYNAGIYAMIESIDRQVGRLLDRLEAAGVLDNTVVVFATDNGPNGDRFRAGLRGTKGQVDEGSVRVPFGIRFPEKFSGHGNTFSTPAAHIDLLPTIMDYLGFAEAIPEDVDGISLVPIIKQRSSKGVFGRHIYAFKQGYDFDPNWGSVRNAEELYVRRGGDNHEYYDLVNDPFQTTNLYSEDNPRAVALATTYADFAPTVAPPPGIIAPPIDLDAAPGPVRLAAHEGEPLGNTRFAGEGGFGWANDYFVDLGPDGVRWPITTATDATYDLVIKYQLEGEESQKIMLGSGADTVEVDLPPATAERIPVADRTPRKEVYPFDWAEFTVGGVRVPAGSKALKVWAEEGSGLQIKEIAMRVTSK